MTPQTPAVAKVEKWLQVRFFPNFWLRVNIRVWRKNSESCRSRLLFPDPVPPLVGVCVIIFDVKTPQSSWQNSSPTTTIIMPNRVSLWKKFLASYKLEMERAANGRDFGQLRLNERAAHNIFSDWILPFRYEPPANVEKNLKFFRVERTTRQQQRHIFPMLHFQAIFFSIWERSVMCDWQTH